jgi:hypothetical protein
LNGMILHTMILYMDKPKKFVVDLKKEFLSELGSEVDERFEGNKASAARAVQMARVPFTNLCNAREGVTLDKLFEVGVRLGWDIDVRFKRKSSK